VSNERQQRAARAEQMRKEREKADRKQRNLITVGIVVVVVALIAVGGYAVKSESDKNKTVEDVINPVHVTKDYGVDYTTEVATGKPSTAPVKVVAYEDFQCPACLNFEQQSGAFLADAVAKGDITMEYRPISFLDEKSNGNRYSSRAGSAAICVLDKSGVKAFKKMHDVLYANQPEELTNGRTDSELIDYAKQAGVTGIDSCIKSERFVPWIEEATQASRGQNVTATPTVMVDGKKIDAPTPEALQTAIDAAKKS
jgi:protein-disulfide isomerase